MKKFLVIMVLIAYLIIPFFAFAETEEPVNTSIDSITWTAISLDGSTACKNYIFQSRDGSDFKWKKTAGSTNYFTVRDGTAISVTFTRERQPGVLFYAQSVSGSPVIEVFVFNDK